MQAAETSLVETPGTDTAHGRPTLLLFTLGAVAETDRRRLMPSTCRAEEIAFHRACLDSVVAAGRQADCRLVVSSPAAFDLAPDALRIEQRGRGFGHRLSRAIQDAFDASQATGPVVVVGGDSPDLESDDISTAIRAIDDQSAEVVLGPCPDGGLYLLATARPLTGLLEAVRWCRPSTLDELTDRLEAAGLRVALLAPRRDLDRPADLDRWLSTGTASYFDPRLLRALTKALSAHRRPTDTYRAATLSLDPRRVRRDRAPPRAA